MEPQPAQDGLSLVPERVVLEDFSDEVTAKRRQIHPWGRAGLGAFLQGEF